MNIPSRITLKWLKQTSDETVELYGHTLNINAHLLAAQNRIGLVRDGTARWHVAGIKGSATINTLQILCLVGSREDLKRLHLWVWTRPFLTTKIPKTGLTALEWLTSRNLLDLVGWSHKEPKEWIHHLPALRTAARDSLNQGSSWLDDEQFAYTDLLALIEKTEEAKQDFEDEQFVLSLKAKDFARLLPLVRYVRRHGSIPVSDDLIREAEKLKRLSEKEKIKLDTDES